MFEHFTTAQEIFHYKLASALDMEYVSFEMLGRMEKTAMRSELQDLFREYAHETRQQIETLEECFASMGEEAIREPSPSMKGLAKETKSSAAKTDNMLVDAVVLSGALETKHHETAVYESLIIQAKALDMSVLAELLNQNLLQEKAAIEKIKSAADTVARANAEFPSTEEGTSDFVTEVPPYLPPGSI